MTDIPEQGRDVSIRPQAQAVTSAMALFDSDKFAHMQRMAKALQFGSMLPRAVRGESPDECFSNLLVCFDMADRLKVTPIALAQTVSMVHGKMVLEGKLVQAAIQNILGFTLYPWWTGERGTDTYRIYLSDKPWDAESIKDLQPGAQFFDRRVIDGSVGEWKTLDKNKQTMPAWTGTQTQNQTLYRGTREWARRYEPGIMLGVYTDDEITAAEERSAARANTATVSLSALSTGFAGDPKPDPKAEAIEDAVVEEITDDAAPSAEDLQQMDDAFEGFEAAKEKAKLDAKVADIQKAADGEARKEVEEASTFETALSSAYAAGIRGKVPGVDVDIDLTGLTDEQVRQVQDKYRMGFARMGGNDDAAQLPDGVAAAGLDEAMGGPKANEEVAADKAKADRKPRASKAKAKTKDDDGTPQPEDPGQVDPSENAVPTDDDAQPDDSDAFPMKAPAECPVDQFVIDLGDMRDWPTIKAALVKVSGTEAWSVLDPRDQKVIRHEVWAQMDRLIQGGQTQFDFLNDLSAFRCWLEWYAEEDGILGNWDILVSMDHFAALDADSQKRLQSAVNARVTELRGGVH